MADDRHRSAVLIVTVVRPAFDAFQVVPGGSVGHLRRADRERGRDGDPDAAEILLPVGAAEVPERRLDRRRLEGLDRGRGQRDRPRRGGGPAGSRADAGERQRARRSRPDRPMPGAAVAAPGLPRGRASGDLAVRGPQPEGPDIDAGQRGAIDRLDAVDEQRRRAARRAGCPPRPPAAGAPRRSSSALRYGRVVVIAEKASPTARIRATSGISSPASRVEVAVAVPALVVMADAGADDARRRAGRGRSGRPARRAA